MAIKDWGSIANQGGENESNNNEEADFAHEREEEHDLVKVEVKEKVDSSDPSFSALEEKVREAEEKAAENWDKAVRAMSELENTRRRAEKDIANAHKFSVEKFAKELLPILDSLEQALLAAEKDEASASGALKEGVELTLKMFQTSLEKFQVQVIDPKGESFDPNLHEAMSMVPTAEFKANTVVDVFQKGYTLHGRVMRPARVVIAKAVESET